MQNSVAKKIFAVGSAVAMTLTLVAPLAVHAAAHTVGSNVLGPDGKTVWFITANNTRRAYTSAGAFLSYGFNSWSTVAVANSDDLALAVDPLGFIPPADGTIFCATETKASDVKGECSLITGGVKARFTAASVFTGLGFSFSRAISGDSSFLNNSTNIDNTTAAHRPGVLVNNNGTVQLVGGSGLLGIPSPAVFYTWGYSFNNVVPANAADKAMVQTGVMVARLPGQLSPTWTVTPPCTSNCTPVINGSVTASLAADTPAAGTLVSGNTLIGSIYPSQVSADIAHFMFSGSGTVTQVKINRIGVSADASVNNVYLYMGNNRITDAGSFSNGSVTFSNSNGLFTVNGSTTIGVRIDVAGQISGQTIGAQLGSFAVASGSPMTANISGNLFTTAQVTNLATANVTGAASNPPHTGTNDVTAGLTNFPVWSYNVSIGQRAVLLKYIQFKQIGSISQDAIQNLHLYVDGASIGPVSSITNSGSNTNVVIFDLSGSPFTLNTGSHLVELHGDIVKGTSFTFDFSLQNSADVVLVDPNYNVNIQLTNANATLTQLAPGVSQISSGTVSVQQDPAFTATQFVANSSNVTLGSWTMKAYGEDVRVQSLNVTLNATGGNIVVNEGFNNLSLYVNGGQVGSSKSALAAGTVTVLGPFTYGGTNLFTIPAGTTVVVQLKGDSVYTSSTYTAIAATLTTPTSSLQGGTSFALSGTGQNYVGNTLTTSAGSTLGTVGQNTAYTNNTVGSNLSGVKLASYVIQASNADGIRVNSVVTAPSTTLSTFNNNGTVSGQTATNMDNALANVRVVVTYPGGTATGNPQQPASSNTFSLSGVLIPANQSATVDVFADVSNATGTIVTTMYVNGQGQTSNTNITAAGFTSSTAVTGQTVTAGTGTLSSPTLDITQSAATQFVVGGSSNTAAYDFTSTGGTSVITEIDFTVTGTGVTSTATPISSVTVGGVTKQVLAANNTSATATVTGLNITVPTGNAPTVVPVTVTYSTVGTNGLPSNVTAILTPVYVKYLAGSVTKTAIVSGAPAKTMDLVGAVPSLALVAAPVGTLQASGGLGTSAKIGSFTLSVGANQSIIATSVPFSISFSGGATTTIGGQMFLHLAGQNATFANATDTLITSAGGGTSVTDSITFTGGGFALNGGATGASQTFDVYIPVSGTFATSPGASVNLSLGASSLFFWIDVTGGSGVISGSTNTTYLVNYPTSSVQLHN